MALRFIDSFDHYQTADIHRKWTNTGGNAVIGIGLGRCGTNCLDLDRNNEVGKGIHFQSITVTIGFAFHLQTEGTDPGRNFNFLTLNGAEGTGGWLLSLRYNADGSIAVHQYLNGTLLGQTAPGLIHQDVWHYFELKATLGDAPVGAVEFRVDGVAQVSASGVDTLPDGELPDPRQIVFLSGSFAGGQHYRIDDLYALDSVGPAPWNTFLGDTRVEYLRPKAAGPSQDWTPVGAPSHWQAVDDNATPDLDLTYTEANAAGLTDTHLYTPTGLPPGQPIHGAQLSLLARKSDVGSRVLAPVVSGVTGAPVGISFDDYHYYSSVTQTNPATGLPWTVGEINNIQAGQTVVT